LAAGKRALLDLGFRLVEHPQIERSQGYLAGTDDERVAAIHELLAAPEVDLLWATRGGYGLHRIVDRIDPEKIAAAQKPIIGFSDLTALHAITQSRADLISIHGPVVTQLGDLGDEDRRRAVDAVAGRFPTITASGPAIQPGTAEGRLVGGCLSVIAPLVGSGFLPNFHRAIVVLEDVGEATYRIDRLLTQLRLSGLLGRAAGIATGEFAGCGPRNEREQTLQEVLSDRLGDLGIPVLTGLPFGHGRRNVSLPLGARARLDAGAGTLEVLGP
jgi:muramoyltetrapeptide carboxypeptidase